MKEKPDKSEWMYQFTQFTLQLNYLPDTLRDKLSHTDSRLRPDQRALENGDTELAIKEKHRLEEAQRARRKEHEMNGTHHVPAYFEEQVIETSGQKIWKFNGKYWQDRSNRDWSNLIHIYD